jgi:hypothetical protein
MFTEALMNRFSNILWCGLAGAGMVAGCGGASEASLDPATDPPAKVARQEACPLALAGATSSNEDTVDGVVVTFSTPRPGDRPELARRVTRMAEVHNSMRGGAPDDLAAAPPQAPGPAEAPEGTGDASRVKGASGAETAGAQDSKATAETTEDGVRLVLRPADPARLDSMRDHLRKQADELVHMVCEQARRKGLH